MDKKIKESIEQEINSNDVHLFMKGTPLFPQCGFSSTVVQILTYLEVPFTTTNVLDDEGIREGIKEFSTDGRCDFGLFCSGWSDATDT
jgi:monothiol glutaredoxin